MKTTFYKNSGSDSNFRDFTEAVSVKDTSSSLWYDSNGTTNDKMNDSYYRVLTEQDTWVRLYQDVNFAGKNILIPPSSDYYLNDYDFGDIIVSSYIISNQAIIDENSIVFWDKENFTGKTLEMSKSGSLNDFSCTSLAVGQNVYAFIHSKVDDTEYGSFRLLMPSDQLKNLGTEEQNIDGGYWEGDIETVKIYSSPPVTGGTLVDPNQVITKFFSSMQLTMADRKSDPSRGFYYDINMQEATYEIRVPYFMPSTDNNQWNVIIQTQYGVTFEDPTGQITFGIDGNGNLNGDFHMTYDLSGPLEQACGFASGEITITEDVAKFMCPALEGNMADFTSAVFHLSAIDALSPFMIADAISLALSMTQMFIDDIKANDKTANYYYFPIFTTHMLVKLMYAYNQEQFGDTSSNNLQFDETDFNSNVNSLINWQKYTLHKIDYSIDYSGTGMLVSFILLCLPDLNSKTEKYCSPQEITIIAVLNYAFEVVAITSYYFNLTGMFMSPGLVYFDNNQHLTYYNAPGCYVHNYDSTGTFWGYFESTWEDCAQQHEMFSMESDEAATLQSTKDASSTIQAIITTISQNMTFNGSKG